MLEEVTGLESTYLTTIDLEAGTQSILYARNSKTLLIPENLTVPWQDTLCKRALDEGKPYTDDVSACWSDSDDFGSGEDLLARRFRPEGCPGQLSCCHLSRWCAAFRKYR